jgi:hypothetical protein
MLDIYFRRFADDSQPSLLFVIFDIFLRDIFIFFFHHRQHAFFIAARFRFRFSFEIIHFH